MKILIVEDDLEISKLLADFLQENGYEVLCQYDGLHVLDCIQEHQIDLILLDIMLPYRSGDTILADIRKFSTVPVIVISAKETTQNKIDLLRLGADDYITKPFSLAVLRARVNTQLRNRTVQMQKESTQNTQIWEGSIWKFDFTNMRFIVSGQEVELSKTEQKLLALLVQHAGMTVPRETLMDRIWTDGAVYVDENALSVAIKRLRDKLQAKEQIRTVYGIGYVWEV